MSAASPPATTSFPYPTQVVYDGRTDEVRVAVDVAPATREDVTLAVGTRRLWIAVDRGDDIAERAVTPLPRPYVFGDGFETTYTNGVLSATVEAVERRRR